MSLGCSATRKLDTTALYAQVATKTMRSVTSPLDKLGMFTDRRARIAPAG